MTGQQVIQDSQSTAAKTVPAGAVGRLTDFEYYMLADDRPTHPMVCLFVVTVSGVPDPVAFRQAVVDTVLVHRLLHSRVINTRQAQSAAWEFIAPSTESLPVTWHAAEELQRREMTFPVLSIDLRDGPAFRIRIHEASRGQKPEIGFYIHHAACDGIGGLQFVTEVMARYGCLMTRTDEKRPDWTPLNPDLLFQRSQVAPAGRKQRETRRSLTTVCGKLYRLLLRCPVRICGSGIPVAKADARDEIESPAEPPAAIRRAVIPRPVARRLRAAAAAAEVSANDLCIAAMMVHIRRWNQERTRWSDRSWIRVTVPVNMRTEEHRLMPAANVVSYAFVTRRGRDCLDPKALLQSIHQQTHRVLYNREGIVPLSVLGALRKFGRWLPRVMTWKSCISTVVVANVGDLKRRFHGRFPLEDGDWKAGDLRIEEITGVAPVRPNTRIAVSLADWKGSLLVCLRADETVLSGEDAERFLAEYTQRLTELAEETTGDTSE